MQVSTTIRKAAVVTTAAGVLLAGATGVANAATHHGHAEVVFHVSKHGFLHAPATTHPGRMHLHATGSHTVIIVKRKHQGVDRLVSDSKRKSPARLFADFTVVGVVDRDGYATLARGTYYIASDTNHLSAAKIATMKVTGSRRDAKAPASSTYRTDSHNVLHAPASQPRQHWVHFVNSTSHPEGLFLIGISNKTSNADIQAYLAHPTFRNEAKLDIVSFRIAGIIGAHRGSWTNAHLGARRYLVQAVRVDNGGPSPRGARLVTAH